MRLALNTAHAVPLLAMRLALSLILLAAAATSAQAQSKDPLPTFVVDVRGLFAKLGQDGTTAFDLGVEPTQLPGTAIGAGVGVTFYPLKRQKLSLGVGGEGLLARAVESGVNDQTGAPEGPRIERRLQGISGTISLNFGHGQGWSYVSAGAGPLRFQTFSGDAPLASPPFEMTQNFGAGARWFTSSHIAFCFDLRFYLTKPVPATIEFPGRLRQRVMVMSAGISIK